MVLSFAPEVFQPPDMSQTSHAAARTGPGALAGVQIQLLPTAKTKARRHSPAKIRSLVEHLDGDALEKILLQVQEQIRSPAPQEELIVLDGKQPRHGGGHSVLTAVTVPSQHYLGSALVDTKTNEIPVARELFKKLDLDGRQVSLDALHTQDQTARKLVLAHGADYLLTVKDNQPTVREKIERLAVPHTQRTNFRVAFCGFLPLAITAG